jgi:hypothetical protein
MHTASGGISLACGTAKRDDVDKQLSSICGITCPCPMCADSPVHRRVKMYAGTSHGYRFWTTLADTINTDFLLKLYAGMPGVWYHGHRTAHTFGYIRAKMCGHVTSGWNCADTCLHGSETCVDMSHGCGLGRHTTKRHGCGCPIQLCVKLR